MSANHVPVAKLTSPADIVAMIPYVLGFVPGQSLVLVALEGARRRFGPVLRMDLAETSREMAEQVDYLIALVEAQVRRGARGRVQRRRAAKRRSRATSRAAAQAPSGRRP